MLLNYFKGKNFGDALNPIIFNKLLPGFFDTDRSQEFFGIGSIIGIRIMQEAKYKIIFSSGYAYGTLPKVDSSYDILCVRGPLTAKALKIDKSLAVADGALLLREFQFPRPEKKFRFSFMPHWESEPRYPWKKLCEEAGIHYVSPRDEPMQIIEQILQSEAVIAEAMHYAIVADALRVPWVAVKAYPMINEFKWNDWALSLNMPYKPLSLGALFEDSRVLSDFLKAHSKIKLPELVYNLASRSYMGYQGAYLEKSVLKRLQNATRVAPQLSRDGVFDEKVDALLNKLVLLKKKYGKVGQL